MKTLFNEHFSFESYFVKIINYFIIKRLDNMKTYELPVRSPQNKRVKKMRGFFRKVRSACRKNRDYPERLQDTWCNFFHIHLDWYGYGDYSHRARMLFIQEYASRFDQFAKIFTQQKLDFQLWILIHLYDSGADSLFFHTPNPHSEFPIKLHDMVWSSASDHIFTRFLPAYEIIEGQGVVDKFTLAYYAKGIGAPLG